VSLLASDGSRFCCADCRAAARLAVANFRAGWIHPADAVLILLLAGSRFVAPGVRFAWRHPAFLIAAVLLIVHETNLLW